MQHHGEPIISVGIANQLRALRPNSSIEKTCRQARSCLSTVSNKPRLTPAEKEDYFHHFLENKPSGKIDLSTIGLGCNTAVDAGLCTFTFAKTGAVVSGRYSYTYRWDGSQWLITSHHSSKMPENK